MCLLQKPDDEELERYRVYSKLAIFQNRVNEARDTIMSALKKSKKPALSFSGGKDSVVLLDIAVQAGFSGELVFFKYGIANDVETPKENVDILKYYAKKHGLRYNVLDCLGEVDCWEECGRLTLEPETKDEMRAFDKTNYDYAKKARQWEEENGIDLEIIGMRKDESLTRKIVLSKKGAIYTTKSRSSVTCCPLLNFKNEDIWAYIFGKGLPYLSIYDYPYIDRRKNRNEVTLLYNRAIIENGMMFHYKQMYPEYFDWIKERWGGIW